MPIADSSWGFGTIRGIIDPSAGVRTTVVRLMPRLRTRSAATFAPAAASPTVSSVRIAFGTISAQRTSSRSTRTPATADKRIVGIRNDITRALTAAFDRVVANTRIVSAYSDMLPPTCVEAWMNQSRPKVRSRMSGANPVAVIDPVWPATPPAVSPTSGGAARRGQPGLGCSGRGSRTTRAVSRDRRAALASLNADEPRATKLAQSRSRSSPIAARART